jgi:hypothetical protein
MGTRISISIPHPFASVFADDIRQYTVLTVYLKFKEDKQHSKILFELMKNESLGTQKFLGILDCPLYSIKDQFFQISILEKQLYVQGFRRGIR